MARDKPPHPYSNLSRRQLVGAMAGAGAAGLAGCFGTDPDDENGNGDENGDDVGVPDEERDLDGDPISNEFTAASLGNVPTEMHWNEFNFINYEFMLGEFIHDPLAIWNSEKSEHVPCLAEDWNFDMEEEIFEITLRDDYEWWHGEPVTAEDVYIHFELEQYMGFSSSDFVESGEITGDYTIEFPLRGDFQEDVVATELLRQDMTHAPYERYGEWLERFEDADSQDEIDEISGELLEYAPEDPMAYGPFELVEFTETEVRAELFEGHPASDDINFTEFTWVHMPEMTEQYQALSAGEFDALLQATAAEHIRAEFPDEISTIEFPSHGGHALTPNHNREPFDDRRVRHAIGHAVVNDIVADNVGEGNLIPIEYHTGMSDEMAEDWIADLDIYERLEFDIERAQELLEDAGLTNTGDSWELENGDTFEINLYCDSDDGDAVAAAQTCGSQIRELGIDVEVQTAEAGAYWDNILPDGEYDLAITEFDGDYNTPFHLYNGQITEDGDGRDLYHMAEEVEAPPVGEPDGSLQTYNVEEIVEALRTSSGDAYDNAVAEAAWVWNYVQPKIQLYEVVAHEYVNTEDWYWPTRDDESMIQPPAVWAPKYGTLQAQTE